MVVSSLTRQMQQVEAVMCRWFKGLWSLWPSGLCASLIWSKPMGWTTRRRCQPTSTETTATGCGRLPRGEHQLSLEFVSTHWWIVSGENTVLLKDKPWELWKYFSSCVLDGISKGEKLQFFFVSDFCPGTVLGSFVSDVVHIYYTSDERVDGDEEIQAFVKDVCSFGMQDFDQCGGYTLHMFKKMQQKNIVFYPFSVFY